VRAAAVQLRATLDKGANLAAASEAVLAAADGGADLVVLPEAAMADFGGPSTDLAALAEPLDGPFVASVADLARATGTTVVAGMFEAVPGDARVFNTVVAVDGGGLLARYRKLHLYDALGWTESDRVLAGDPTDDGVAVVAVKAHRVGIMTCYDLRFPEMARALCDAGADTLVVCAAWVDGPKKVVQWRDLLHARAIESTAYVVAAAQPAPVYAGHSMVVDPSGEALVELDGVADARAASPGDATAFGDLSLDEVASVRASMPVLAHRRFAVGPVALTARPSP